MNLPLLLLSACTALYIYAASGCWMLQIVCYPTYHLVGEREFVPFHVAFGQRLIPVFVAPAVVANVLSLIVPFVRPAGVPLWLSLVPVACSLVILATTGLIEVPKHLALDRDGKSTALIDGLVSNNLPRAVSWTVGSAAFIALLSLAFRSA